MVIMCKVFVMSSLCVTVTYLSILVVLTASVLAPLPRDCVPGICHKVDSDDWTRLQSRCCTDHNVYHCQVGHDARVQAVCSKMRHCDASQAVVVTSIGVECRRCLKGSSEQVPAPSYYHTRLSQECGARVITGQGQTSSDPSSNSNFEDEHDTKPNLTTPNIIHLPGVVYLANRGSGNKNLTSQNRGEETWVHIFVAVVAMVVALVILFLFVFFMVRCSAGGVNRTKPIEKQSEEML